MKPSTTTFTHYKVIELIIATIVIIGGIYLFAAALFPAQFINLQGASGALAHSLTNTISLCIFALLYFTPGVTLLYGVLKDKVKFRLHSLFVIYCMIFFTQFLSILIHGLIPPTYLSPLALGSISAVIWVRINKEIKSRGGKT